MPRTYKIPTAFIALIGSVSLIVTGEIRPEFTAIGIGLLPAYYHFLRGGEPAPKWAVGMFSLLTLAVFAFDAFVSRDIFLAVGHLTIVFQVIKAFDLRDPWDHLQVYFVALLQLLIASELTSAFAFGLIFVVFIIMLVTAMVLSHFLGEGTAEKIPLLRPLVVITSLTVFTTAVFFLALPRTPYRFVSKGHLRAIRTAGFSEVVDFGSFGTVKLDPTVVMRVELKGGGDAAYYWRGVTLDYFDGRTWRHSAHNRTGLPRSGDLFLVAPFETGLAVTQSIYLEPLDSDVIFGLPTVRGIKTDASRLFLDREGGIYLPGKVSRSVTYTAYSITEESVAGAAEGRYLQLPPDIQKIRALALKTAAGGRNDEERAFRIENYLKKNYAYSLTVRRPPAGVGPIEDFLFNTRQGYCEHYATSMVMMLRALGIPSRIVNGFYGGERNAYGDYVIVRQSDAHSWVEALINGYWKRFDPTPQARSARHSTAALLMDSVTMAWARYVVGFTGDDQRTLVKAIVFPVALSSLRGKITVKPNPYFFVIPFGIIAVFIVIRLVRIRGTRHGFSTSQFLKLSDVLRKRGVVTARGATCRTIRRGVSGTPVADRVEEFVSLYEAHRFGRRELTPEDRTRYSVMLHQIRRGLRQTRSRLR